MFIKKARHLAGLFLEVQLRLVTNHYTLGSSLTVIAQADHVYTVSKLSQVDFGMTET